MVKKKSTSCSKNDRSCNPGWNHVRSATPVVTVCSVDVQSYHVVILVTHSALWINTEHILAKSLKDISNDVQLDNTNGPDIRNSMIFFTM